MKKFKPERYTTVSPYLIVSNCAGTIKFLQNVFGATLLRSFTDADGRLMHAEVRLDDTVIMLADSTPEWPPIPSYVHVYVDDVDSIYSSAIQFGATSVQQPVKKQDEDKRGGVKDIGGTTWWIATRIGP